MGKTNPTHRDQIGSFEDEWSRYRRSLRREYQDHWDAVIEQARNRAHAAGNQNPVQPEWGIVFSVLVSQEKRIADLEAQLEDDDGDE